MPVDLQADLEALYAAIMARVNGRQVSQTGHKDKQASFANTPLADMIKLYRQLWFVDSGLPELNELSMPTTRRGRPVGVAFGDRG